MDLNQQSRVTERFQTHARSWQDLYQATDASSHIYQLRHARALGLIDQLELLAGSHVLEVGSGAGYTAVALAYRGFQVEALDATPALLDIAQRAAADASVTSRVRATLGDVHRLPFADGRFDLVVALGVMPWLHAPALGLAEMARALRPGGYLIISADNRGRLTHLLDPLLNPALRPVRQAAKTVLRAGRLWQPQDHGVLATYHSVRQFDRMIAAVGLERRGGATFGFAPLTVLGHKVVPERSALQLHVWLQGLADRRLPWLRSAGAQYLVLATKP